MIKNLITPSFEKQNLFTKVKEKNTNHFALHYLYQSGKSLIDLNSIDRSKFYLKHFYENLSLPSYKLHENQIQDLYNRMNSSIISVDFNKENNMLLVLRKIGSKFYLHIKQIYDLMSNDFLIQTSENFLLGAKFYGAGFFERIVIIGLNLIYIIRIDTKLFNKGENVVINLNPSRENAQSNQITFINEINNAYFTGNATDVSFTVGKCYLIIWSYFSKKIRVIRKSNKMEVSITLSHWFDSVEVSKQSQLAIFYDSTNRSDLLTIIDFDNDYRDTIDISFESLKKFDN